MSNELIMNITPGETRIARLEEGAVGELYIERADELQTVGNVYKGVVTRVLPGMQAAFVDIGLEKAAFLYVADVVPDLFEVADDDESDESDENTQSGVAVSGNPPDNSNQRGRQSGQRRGRRQRGPIPKIEEVLREGQHVVVQVAKEPIRTKGARVTCHISFPGRFVVAMPTVDHVGVSRRLGSFEERQRLKKVISENRKTKCGFIARTLSRGAADDAIAADMLNLEEIWKSIEKKQDSAKPPALLYQDSTLVLRCVRDLMSPEIDRLVVDSEEDYREILAFMHKFMPDLAGRVELYTQDAPIFDVYGIETEINRALGKKVWLKSGGYLIIDQSEALTAIDINTGRFVGRDNFEDTILQTNLEAAEEIAYQLRLRNIGGIIIIDFIDMDRHANRQKVFYALKDALRKDRIKTSITKVSDLGLIEMTRKRTRDALNQTLSEDCHYCHGNGLVKTPQTVAFEVFRQIRRSAKYLSGRTLVVEVNPRVARIFFNEARSRLEFMEASLQKRIAVEPMESFHVEKFELRSK